MIKALILHELIQTAEKARFSIDSREVISALDTDLLMKIQSHLQDYSTGKRIRDDFKRNDLLTVMNQLVDPILLLNKQFPSSYELGKIFYTLSKQLLVAEILMRLMMQRAALFVADEVIKQAEANKLISLIYPAYKLKYKIYHYSGDLKAADHSRRGFVQYLNYYRIESELEMDYQNVLAHYSVSKTNDKRLLVLCEVMEHKYKPYLHDIPSFFFHNYYYFVLHIKLIILRQHDLILENAHNALQWLAQHSPNYIPGILTFRIVQITYYIQKAMYANGRELILMTYAIINKNSQHWFRVKENELLLLMHQGDYEQAIDLFYSEFTKSSFLSIYHLDQQRWQLYQAYIQLIIALDGREVHPLANRFSVNKLVNELPRFSKDKRAMNIPLLIVQFLFLITKKKYGNAIERIEALGKYMTRYLRNDETFRSNCFIHMLLLIPKHGFNRVAVERNANPLFERMIKSEIQLIAQPFEIEIIPYENLWEIILTFLSPKYHFRDGRSRI